MAEDRLAEIKARLTRAREEQRFYGPHSALADIDWLVGEVERLQRFEAMFEDCARHRDQAEQRARYYIGIVQQIEKLVAPDEEEV